jgi:hypothetical protein
MTQAVPDCDGGGHGIHGIASARGDVYPVRDEKCGLHQKNLEIFMTWESTWALPIIYLFLIGENLPCWIRRSTQIYVTVTTKKFTTGAVAGGRRTSP